MEAAMAGPVASADTDSIATAETPDVSQCFTSRTRSGAGTPGPVLFDLVDAAMDPVPLFARQYFAKLFCR